MSTEFTNLDALNKYNPLPPDRPNDGLVDLETDPTTGRTRVTGPQTEIPPGRTPSLAERLLGPQMQMAQTGFFIPENDYTGVSGTITRKGAHIAVANELAKIKFVAGTFGGMQNRVAIIRYWCGKGKCTQKATVAAKAVESAAQASVPETAAQQATRLAVQPVNFNTSAISTNLGQEVSSPRQAFPLPDTTGGREAQQGGQPTPVAPAPAPTQQQSGTVQSANPGTSSTTSTAEAAWQFLFNPEELQLESGPEFNRAETWGVSDLPGSGTANSGQPLAWRFNKNRKLIFGKVLLTGYVLGRRVDSLEKGLQQLFMARSGPGMDGPPVLEFVWGDRVFGPCVIQNLRVRERAWDAGNLVNAEVSFDLEQVPEWTINDGAVDIARPGRQSLVNDPFLPRAEQETAPGTTSGAGGETQKKDEKGGGGGAPTSSVTPSLQAKCQAAYKKQGEFAGLAGKLTNIRLQGIQISQIRNPFESLDSYKKRVLSAITGPYLKEYGDLHREASSLVGEGFTYRVGGYYSPTTLSIRVSSFAANKTKSIEDVAAEIRIAAQKAQAASKNVVDSECKEVIKSTG